VIIVEIELLNYFKVIQTTVKHYNDFSILLGVITNWYTVKNDCDEYLIIDHRYHNKYKIKYIIYIR